MQRFVGGHAEKRFMISVMEKCVRASPTAYFTRRWNSHAHPWHSCIWICGPWPHDQTAHYFNASRLERTLRQHFRTLFRPDTLYAVAWICDRIEIGYLNGVAGQCTRPHWTFTAKFMELQLFQLRGQCTVPIYKFVVIALFLKGIH